MKKSSTEEFIAKAKAMHGDKYDYSKVVYVNSRTKVCIICPEHGEFWQIPNDHVRGIGCPACGNVKKGKNRSLNLLAQRPDLSHIETPPGSKAVPVGTKGDYALVDEEDYERVMEHNWSFGGHGYVRSNTAGKLHRFIMNTPKGMDTDHKDLDRLNNRKNNLRVCARHQNMTNKGLLSNNTSGYKGVSWHKTRHKWQVALMHRGKRVYVDTFDDIVEAARAYDEAAKKYHKDFARLNFPEGGNIESCGAQGR